LENKIENIEIEIKEMKQNFETFIQEIRTFMNNHNNNNNNNNNIIDTNSVYNNNNNNRNNNYTPNKNNFIDTNQNIIQSEQMLQVALKECSNLINQKFTELQQQQQLHQMQFQQQQQYQQGGMYSQYQPNNPNIYQYTSGNNNNNNNISTDSNLNSFEARMNKKMEERLKLLANNIEDQVLKYALQPSIKKLESKLKEGVDEINDKINNLNIMNSNNNNNNNNQSAAINTGTNIERSENISFVDSYRCSRSIQSSMGDVGKSSQRKNDKLDVINKIGGRLYDKLLEKEKKIMDLKNETTNYLKKKLKNDEKRYSQQQIPNSNSSSNNNKVSKHNN
jgi:hypothetical protein